MNSFSFMNIAEIYSRTSDSGEANLADIILPPLSDLQHTTGLASTDSIQKVDWNKEVMIEWN